MANETLGTDILFNIDGDIEIGPDGDLMDTDQYDIVTNAEFSGKTNFLLSIYEKITNYQGSYPFQPFFGKNIRKYLGINFSKAKIREIKDFIEESFLTDPRVKEVKNIDITIYSNIMDIKISVLLIGQINPQTLNFPQILINS